jgi:hypothetical protein
MLATVAAKSLATLAPKERSMRMLHEALYKQNDSEFLALSLFIISAMGVVARRDRQLWRTMRETLADDAKLTRSLGHTEIADGLDNLNAMLIGEVEGR